MQRFSYINMDLCRHYGVKIIIISITIASLVFVLILSYGKNRTMPMTTHINHLKSTIIKQIHTNIGKTLHITFWH